jgi:hypothetical protein
MQKNPLHSPKRTRSSQQQPKFGRQKFQSKKEFSQASNNVSPLSPIFLLSFLFKAKDIPNRNPHLFICIRPGTIPPSFWVSFEKWWNLFDYIDLAIVPLHKGWRLFKFEKKKKNPK